MVKCLSLFFANAVLLLMGASPPRQSRSGLVASAQPLQFFQNCRNFAPPAVFQGRKIYNSVTGEYMPVKGINYYPRPNAGEWIQTNSIDFFTDDMRSVWERDIGQFQKLGINVVRLYAVAPGVSHDAFMCALKDAGIYAIVGLAADCKGCAITKDPAPDCYPAELKRRGQFIINEFARFDNVLAFSAGNEASLSAGSVFVNGACQKQFIRDMRSYIRDCSNTIRPIPVGLAIADVERRAKATWYNCRSDPDDELENADFIGINSYLHCDGTVGPDGQLLGFEALLSQFDSYQMSVPVMLTEFGCIDPSFTSIDGFSAQRNFLQVDALFSAEYRSEFVGGVVFEYNTEKINSLALHPFTEYGEGNFGIGRFDPVDCDDITIPCNYVPFPQFDTLANKYAAVDTTDEANLQSLLSPRSDLPPPACPEQFPLLDSYDWPSAQVEDRQCAGRVYVTCTNATFLPECTNLGIQFTDSFLSETTPAPTMSDDVNNATETNNTDNPTASPITEQPETVPPTAAQTTATIAPTAGSAAPTATIPTVAPTSVPSARQTQANTLSPTPKPVGASASGKRLASTSMLSLFLMFVVCVRVL